MMNRLDELKEKATQGDAMNSYPIWAEIDHNAEALALMSQLADNAKPETRSIAVNCLCDIKNNDDITRKMIDVLNDPVEDIRHTAVTYLRFNHSADNVPKLIRQLDNLDTIVRSEVALLLGDIKDPRALNELKSRSEKEASLSVQKSIMLAMAKLGDKEMKKKVAQQLSINDSKVRFQALEDLKYVDDKSLAWYFIPALGDEGNAFMISDMGKIPPRYMHVGDLAVNMVASWYPGAFSFEINSYKNYSKEEFELVGKYLLTLKKP